ncbi:unnamed protein product [Macrosiphum euphorbiae]|uniref:Mesoderm induction early response protein 1 n=1 Tax=Macrosiphum euphorbiae TaxID=13131 RepID=A0AAV0X4R2_9HEMI|nr:unnamed protein product [Macrosiphum euphorbiae]
MSKRVTNDRSDYSDPTDGSDFGEVKKKTIKVGSDYQAKMPDRLSKYGDDLPYLNVDKLLWYPHNTTDAVIDDYLCDFHQIFHGTNKHVRDYENALFLLLQCGFNTKEALRRFVLNDQRAIMKPWSEEEFKNFENGIRKFNKNFRLIQQSRVPTRKVGELVHFYYFWKKTERHDIVFANKKRLEKKKYAFQPGITFYENEENSILNQKTNKVLNHLINSDIKWLRRKAT